MTILSAVLAKLTTVRPPMAQGLSGLSFGLGGSGGYPQGQAAQMQAYGASGWLFGVVDRITTSVASAEWHLYRKQRNKMRAEIDNHPFLDFWERPNAFYSGEDFRETGHQHMELAGETWWLLVGGRRGGPPAEMWLVRPDRMRPIPHPTDFISGYSYQIAGVAPITLEPEDVVYFKTPNPLDPYRGMSRIAALMMDLGSEAEAAAWTRNFFRNGAEPGGVIEFPEILDDREYEKFVLRWRQEHQGASNAHRVAVLEGAKWVDRKYSQRDMQFEQLRKLNRDLFLGAFGMPASMMGVSENVNRANAEAGEVMYSRWLIVPRLRRIRAAANAKLVPLWGDNLYLDFKDPTPDNQELDLKIATEAFKARLITQNEGRLLLEYDEVVGGDEFDSLPAPSPTLALPPGSTETDDAQGEKSSQRERILIRSTDSDPLLSGPEERAEAAMRRAWERRLAQEAESLAGMLEAKTAKVELSDADGYDWDWYGRYGEEVIAELTRIFELAMLTAEPAIEVPVVQFEAARWARARAEGILSLGSEMSMAQSTKARVYELVAETVERGDSLQTLQKKLREDYMFSRGRAETVARTETATALGYGSETAALRQGREEKYWITQADSHVEDKCRQNTAQGWIPIRDKFATGHYRVPAHTRCRCNCLYRTKPVSDVDPSEGLAEDVADAIAQSRREGARLHEVRCPDCNKLLGKGAAPGTTLWCRRCKKEVACHGSGGQPTVVRSVTRRVEHDDEGRIVAIHEEETRLLGLDGFEDERGLMGRVT